jgi:excisionase family DNA binding protein
MDSEEDDNERAATARKGSPFLNTEQAAHYLCISRRTLEDLRRQGKGPPARRHGRLVRYHIADLEAWSTAHDEKKSPYKPRKSDATPKS